MKGSRIYGIVKELRNENIDVVNYTANPSLMIQMCIRDSLLQFGQRLQVDKHSLRVGPAADDDLRRNEGDHQHKICLLYTSRCV